MICKSFFGNWVNKLKKTPTMCFCSPLSECTASPSSLPDRAHAVLRWRPRRGEEPAGSENHRHKARRVQHLGVPVQQLSKYEMEGLLHGHCAFPLPDAWHLLSVWTGAGAVHLQSAVGLLRLRSDIRQVQRLWVRVGMRAKHLQNQQQLDNQHCYWQKFCTFAFLPSWEVI